MGRLDWLRNRVLRPPGATDMADALDLADLALGRDLSDHTDETLLTRLRALPDDFPTDAAHLVEFLAVVKALAARHLGLDPFRVQLAATAAMLRGTSVELATGEGKTLVGALVAAGLTTAGHHVHVLSANDYLAQRDAEWMAPLLTAVGATVACVTSMSSDTERRSAHRSDIVYVPVTEAGFDVLRDRLRTDAADLVGIRPAAAVLDEADAVLLDEGRVPLVLAGESGTRVGSDRELALLAAELREGVHYEVDPDRRTLHLTEDGLQDIERRHPGVDLFGADADLLSRVHTALHAQALLVRDVDYIIEEGRVRLVSQSRGRVEALQRWPEGLQEAVEAKEQLAPSSGVEILDQLLVRDLVSLYSPVVGMSATLVGDATELLESYTLPVGHLPPNRPCIRVDAPDILYATREERDDAAIDLVREHHERVRPVLVATQSVAESERFGTLLRGDGLACVVLNARNDAEEAAIIADAGAAGRITVSTQMAGRGTDIRLAPGVAGLGGLAIIGLGRFPSRRLDAQLRGRAGRQGDPGDTVFLTSLDDDLVAEFAPDHRAPQRVTDDGIVLDRKLQGLTDHAQRVAEGQQQSLRQLAQRYGKLIALQRERVLRDRREVLAGAAGLEVLDRAIPDRMDALRAQIGEPALARAARTVTLACLDRRWSEHLAHAADLREGIHLRRLAAEDPVLAFNKMLAEAFTSVIEDAHAEAARIVRTAGVVDGDLDLADAGLQRPGATWTYMVSDDHFGTALERAGKFLAETLGLRR